MHCTGRGLGSIVLQFDADLFALLPVGPPVGVQDSGGESVEVMDGFVIAYGTGVFAVCKRKNGLWWATPSFQKATLERDLELENTVVCVCAFVGMQVV